MDTQQRRLYIQWCQSQRVSLSVFKPDGEIEAFLVPGELLRRRSRTFRESLTCYVSGMPIHDTSVETLEDFFLWTMSPQPHIDERASFDQAVKLGIFASKYEIPALSNQITDMIRSNLASNEWKLQASIADEVYEAVPAGGPLREVVRAALGQLPKSITTDLGEGGREEWKATILKHAQLAWDYIEASGSEWTKQAYLTGVCRFHDHEGMGYQNGLSAPCDGCAYAQDECFPRVDQETPAEMNPVDPSTEEPAETAPSSDETFHTAEESSAPQPALESIEEESAPTEEPEPEPAVAEEGFETPIPEVEEAAIEEYPPEPAVEAEPDAVEEKPADNVFQWADEEPAPSEANEVPASEVTDVAASELGGIAPSEVSGVGSSVSNGSNGSVISPTLAKEMNGAAGPESVIEEEAADVPVGAAGASANGNGNGHLTEEKGAQATVVESESSSKKKKKKKNRGNSVSQVK
ncbi:hypothetical protein LTR41_002528 [Exophiala xenobiotica]|nr:hypothetical protein LTR41_002528 [Exophiala xenobiotica]